MAAVWPEPQPDPDVEHGEDLDSHLLPNLARLRALTPDQRHELEQLVADWVGEHVEEFRRRLRSL